jgi:hypothetical protein
MADINVRAWRQSEISSRPYSSRDIKSDGAVTSFDDGLDFPPTAHPVRELITFSIFALGVVSLIVWGVLKLL